MKKVIVFGISKIADALYQTVLADEKADIQIVAFCVDKEYRNIDEKYGLPVVDFDETLSNKFPPDEFEMIVAIGYHDMNRVRAQKCVDAVAMGYTLPGYVHGGVMITDDVRIGENVMVFNDTCIGPGTELGDNTFVYPGAVVAHHCKIGKNNWITSGTVIGGNSEVGDNCFLGIHSTIGHNISVGNLNFIGAGTLVSKNTEDNSVYIVSDTPKYRLDTDRFLKMFKFD